MNCFKKDNLENVGFQDIFKLIYHVDFFSLSL